MYFALKHPHSHLWNARLWQSSAPAQHKHPHRCRHNLSPLYLPGCFHAFCLFTFSLWLLTSLRALWIGALVVPPHCCASGSSSKEASDTSTSSALRVTQGGVLCIQSSCLPRSLRLLFNSSCRQTSGEAVPVDTWLHKQWAPVRFILNRHVQNCMQKVAFFTFLWGSSFSNLHF